MEAINNVDRSIIEDDKEEQVEETIQAVKLNLPKRTKRYITKVLRPNMHLGIYYSQIYEEYNPPSLLNVLAEEKYYK